MGITPQHFHTIPTYILCHFANYEYHYMSDVMRVVSIIIVVVRYGGLGLVNHLLTSCGLLLGSLKTLCRLSPQRSHSIES